MRPRPLPRPVADTDGAAGVEFALVAPLLALLAFGVVDVCDLVRASMKLTHAANTLAKSVAQQTAVTAGKTGSLGDLCRGAQMSIAPFQAAGFSSAVASVSRTAAGAVQEDWETDVSCSATAAAIGSKAAVSAATSLVPNAGDSTIVVKAGYTWSPPIGYVLHAKVSLSQTVFVRPRANAAVLCSNC